jgi:hypothetical protein
MAYADEVAFGNIFAQLTGIDPTKNSWVNSLYAVAKKYVDTNLVSYNDPTIYDLLLTDTQSPELAGFRDRFSVYLAQRSDAVAKGTVPQFSNLSEYVQTEKAYGNVLRSKPAFADLATDANIKQFIAGNVSADEVQARIDNAYYAINTADQALKDQIKLQFPSLSDDELAKSLVTGNTDSIQQKIKFGAAGIAASAKVAGIQTQSNLEDLAKQGVTREQALTGFTKVAAERAGIQQASRMFGGQTPTQAELEAEAIGQAGYGNNGPANAAAKRLRSQVRSQFGGQSGIVTGSLSRKKQV